MSIPSYISEKPGFVFLAVKAQPRSSKNEIGDAIGDELKIKITAPPVDSAANQAIVEFLAEILDCPRNQVELFRGGSTRHKIFRITGMSGTEVHARLESTH